MWNVPCLKARPQIFLWQRLQDHCIQKSKDLGAYLSSVVEVNVMESNPKALWISVASERFTAGLLLPKQENKELRTGVCIAKGCGFCDPASIPVNLDESLSLFAILAVAEERLTDREHEKVD